MLSFVTFFKRIAKITTQVKSQQLVLFSLILFLLHYMYTDLNEITQFIEKWMNQNQVKVPRLLLGFMKDKE